MFQNPYFILFFSTADNREVHRVGFPETLLKIYMLYCIITQESEKSIKLILKGFSIHQMRDVNIRNFFEGLFYIVLLQALQLLHEAIL